MDLHEQPHSTGSTTWSRDFLFWTTAQPNLGFKWCWTLIGVVWAWTSVRTSPEAKYPLAQLPQARVWEEVSNRARVIPPLLDTSFTKDLWWCVGMALGMGSAGKPCELWDLGKSSSVSGKDLGSATFRVSWDLNTTRAECAPGAQLMGDLPFPTLWGTWVFNDLGSGGHWCDTICCVRVKVGHFPCSRRLEICLIPICPCFFHCPKPGEGFIQGDQQNCDVLLMEHWRDQLGEIPAGITQLSAPHPWCWWSSTSLLLVKHPGTAFIYLKT